MHPMCARVCRQRSGDKPALKQGMPTSSVQVKLKKSLKLIRSLP
jgi:hypothetical protein